MSLLIYTDSTTQLEAEFFARKELIAISDTLFQDEPGYTRFASSPQGGLAVAYLGLSLLPNVSTDVDTNNVYINIYPKLAGPGTFLTEPIVRKLYQGIDWVFVGTTDINICVSNTGPNADVALFVGPGDVVCIAPKICSNIAPDLTAPIGTLANGATQLWLRRQAESGQQFTYDSLQLYANNTFVIPPVLYAKNLTGITRTSDEANSSITLEVVDAENLHGKLTGCAVYFGNKFYASIINAVADASVLTLTLTRVPSTEILQSASVDFKITQPSYTTRTGIIFEQFEQASLVVTEEGSNILTGVNSTIDLVVGTLVTAEGIPADTYVTQITGPNSVALSENASLSGNPPAVFSASIGRGNGFINLDTADYTGYGVNHSGEYVGAVAFHGADYVIIDNPAYHSNAIASDAELILLTDLRFALDAGNAPILPYKPILDLPAVTTDTAICFWVTGNQLVKSRPYMNPNYQVIVTGVAYPV